MTYRLRLTVLVAVLLSIAPSTLFAQESISLNAASDVGALEPPSAPLANPKPLLHDRSFLLVSAGLYGGAFLDMYATTKMKQWYAFSAPPSKFPAKFVDGDPLARPIVNLPTPAYFTLGFALATGMNWVGWRLKRSSRFKRIWWLPQTGQITANVYFGATGLCSRNRQISAWQANRPPTNTGCN